MDFENIKTLTNCSCLENCEENTLDLFGIKTNNNRLTDSTFKSYWEKGKSPIEGRCDNQCSIVSVSVSKSTNNKPQTIEIFKELFQLHPGYKPFVAFFKFEKDAGLIKSTPSKSNKFHCDFYKSDEFSNNKIKVEEFISLK